MATESGEESDTLSEIEAAIAKQECERKRLTLKFKACLQDMENKFDAYLIREIEKENKRKQQDIEYIHSEYLKAIKDIQSQTIPNNQVFIHLYLFYRF